MYNKQRWPIVLKIKVYDVLLCKNCKIYLIFKERIRLNVCIYILILYNRYIIMIMTNVYIQHQKNHDSQNNNINKDYLLIDFSKYLFYSLK